jgi:hypothetical protein
MLLQKSFDFGIRHLPEENGRWFHDRPHAALRAEERPRDAAMTAALLAAVYIP